MDRLQGDLQRLAAATGRDAQGAANVWAGTTGLSLVGALNTKAGNPRTAWKDLQGVINQLAGTVGRADALKSVP